MTFLCDTSILIPAFVKDLPRHEASFRMIRGVHEKKLRGFLSTHSIAECYAGLTAFPGESHISPVQAQEVIEKGLISSFQVVDLDQADYRWALERTASKNIRSGVIYDALIFRAALKVKVSRLVTWNVRDFERVSNGEISVVTPEVFA